MYEARTETFTVHQILLKDFSEFRLPLIQRGFVWDEEDVKEFIESLIKGYPVGIITVVKTELELPSIPFLDPDEFGYDNPSGTKYYVLDGQQRLTSLLMVRNQWKIKRDGEILELKPIYYNPDKKELRIKGKIPVGIDFSSIVRQKLGFEKPDEHSLKTLQEIDRNFLIRTIPFYIIEIKGSKPEEEMYRDMAEIFTRINRAGVRLGNLEMFLSFFASTGLGKQNVTMLYREMNKKYGMDLEPIIRFIFSNFGLSQSQISKIDSFKKAINDLSKKYDKTQAEEIINKCKVAIERAMNFLKEELGIVSVDILPSETVLVPIFQHFYDKIPEKSEKRSLLYWFTVASFNGLYSSHTDKRLEDDLKKIREAKKEFPIFKLLESMKDKIRTKEISEKDFKNIEINILRGSAGKRYLFILYILLHINKATDWAGKPIYESYHNLAKHHIFPKDLLIEKGYDDPVLINHLGNLTFMNSGLNTEIQNKKPEEYLNDYLGVLKAHFIPIDKEIWKLEKYEEFIETRMDLIWKAYKENFEIIYVAKNAKGGIDLTKFGFG
ncbi:MAG: DUF262 domain-containing protein [Archaeoglobaceae archaeon]